MQNKIMMASAVAATLIAGTAAASADGYTRTGNSVAWVASDSGFDGPNAGYAPEYGAPQPTYYSAPTVWGQGYYNGSNHPTPSSTQGDVGPDGNNNGTQSGVYRQW